MSVFRILRHFLYYSRLALIVALASPALSQTEVPVATIEGPIPAQPPGHPSLDSIYSASAIDLRSAGYVEEEFFFEGRANRYSTPELETGAIIDSDHPYRSRLVVRRPVDASRFNGIVVVEWLNVTGGPDKDIDWWQSGHHFLRQGYAYVMVSAQQMGIDTMQDWSPQRYGSLDTSAGGSIDNDALSFDIFSAVAKAIRNPGNSNGVDILAGLRPEMLLATGHSQSASRLAVYLNSIHPLEPLYDGFMVHGGGGRIRDDQPVKIFKLMAETDMQRRAATPQPDSDNFRQWEVAGSSHVDEVFELEYARVRNLREGLPIAGVTPRDSACNLPPYSRVPFRDVMNAAFEHLALWVKEDIPPPRAEPLQVKRMLPTVEFARDEHGNILGGIRLAAHAVATARNTGMNGGGSNRFCFLYGSHEPFDGDTLLALYPTRADYLAQVRRVVGQNLADGYILPFAAARTMEAARSADFWP